MEPGPRPSTTQPPSPPPARRRRILLGALSLLAAIAVATVAAIGPTQRAGASDPPKTPPPPPPLPVQVHLTVTESFVPTVTGTGELRADEQVEISAELARKLVAIHVQDGQSVKAGELLFELDRRDLEAQLNRLRAQMRFARASFSRFDSLASSGSVSKEERDLARLRLDDVSAQIGELEVQLERTRITAPFAGTFGLRPVSLGAWVNPGTPLGRLSEVSRLKLDFQLPERYAPLIAPGSTVRFTVDGRQETFEARVSALDTAIDRASRSVVVRAQVDEPRGLLPGTFASVALELAPRDTLFVPSIAVTPSPTGSRVFVIEDGKAKVVPVTVGHREPARVEIVSGLAPGAQVITTNLLRLRPGAPVRPIAPESPAAAPRAGDGT